MAQTKLRGRYKKARFESFLKRLSGAAKRFGKEK